MFMQGSFPYVAIIDVGHGNSSVIVHSNTCFVVDCGLGPTILSFLKQEDVYEIQNVFLSHSDQDHIGGLIGLISSNEFKIHNVYVIADATKSTDLWDDILYSLSHSGVSGGTKLHVGISNTQEPFSCGSITLRVVSPTPYLAAKSPGSVTNSGDRVTSNSVSASFHIEWAGKSIAYLAGDIDHISIKQIIEHHLSIESSLLVFPHHGGKCGDSNVVAFTKTISNMSKAQIVLFSIGRNRHNNPRSDVIQTLRMMIPDVRIACTQLSKSCATILPKNNHSHLLSFFAKGKTTNECCAGTFIIKLGNEVEYLPKRGPHNEFILKSAPTALCLHNPADLK